MKRDTERLDIAVEGQDDHWTVKLEGFEHYDFLAEFHDQDAADELAGVLRQVSVAEVEEGLDIEGLADDVAKAIGTRRWVEQLELKW